MKHADMPQPRALTAVNQRRLFVVISERRKEEIEKTQTRTQYDRAYWQKYKKNIRRVLHRRSHMQVYWPDGCAICPVKAKCTTGKERRIKRWVVNGGVKT